MSRSVRACLLVLPVALSTGVPLASQASRPTVATREAAAWVPALAAMTPGATSELRELVDRYTADRANLLRFFTVPYSAQRRARLEAFYRAWDARLDDVPFETLGLEGRIDWVLMRQRVRYEMSLLQREAVRAEEMTAVLPFADTIAALQEARRLLSPIDGRATATTVAGLADTVTRTQAAIEQALDAASKSGAPAGTNGQKAGPAPGPTTGTSSAKPAVLVPAKVVAMRAAETVAGLKATLDDWFAHYDGYDPTFSWWVKEPHGRAAKALDSYAKVLRERVVGARAGEEEPIIGDPIGRSALLSDLAYELIPYTPEELVRIADREFAWCEAEMKKAARELGFGDDWKAALESVKAKHVEPGQQPTLVRDLAREAIDFLRARDLVTVPPLAEDGWRMRMMTPAQQKVAPFFLGGEVVQVAYPTQSMSQDEKLMSLRANNVHFSRAVVHHELIPGHHLQQFMNERYHPQRRAFGNTPFWGEGWALYWEMLLWDLGFPATAEDRVGFLFWRMHRCARIIFSLRFHLGTMTPAAAIDFLVDRVGHERDSASGEVRRSFNGTYPPLYQAAYMLGGLQFRALHQQLVQSGTLTNRVFHDRILQGGRIPVELVRLRLLGQPPARDHRASWRFVGEP